MQFCLSSRLSVRLITCCRTVKVACWSLTSIIIALYCWTVNYNDNASSSTYTLNRRRSGRRDSATTNSHHIFTFCTAVTGPSCLLSSRHSMSSVWFTTHRYRRKMLWCSGAIASGNLHQVVHSPNVDSSTLCLKKRAYL